MKKHISITFLLLFTVSLIFNQTTSLFKQQDEIKTMIKEQVYSIIELGTELKNNQFGVWVDVALENSKPLPLKSVNAPEVINEGAKDDFYDMITGSRPGVPSQKNISNSARPTVNSSASYYIADLSIRIYLDQNIEGLNTLQTNIKSLVENQLSGILCEDCIEFQLKDFGAMEPQDIGLQEQLDKIKSEMAARELTIIKDKLTSKDSILAVYADQINEHMSHLHQQDSIKQAAEQERMLRLEQNERKYRSKQDSLYVLTSIKLDEAVRGRIQSEETTKKELLSVIKMQIQGDSNMDISEYSDDTQSNLIGKRPMMAKQGLSMQMWLMILALVLLMTILLIMVMKNKQPIYLKPTTPMANNIQPPVSKTNGEPTYAPTAANENDDVLKSEMQSLRQTAVSMSVSEKTGANQIVQDWLDDSSPEGTSDDATETENKE
tara:strand:- start:16 stop:1320 length:1305 start_codon:yes stop_codon:yes gene_type:complete